MNMDFDQAIMCHTQWKSKLAAYIAKPDKSLDAAAVAQDDRCDLGKWIHGEGRKYANSAEFEKLVADHKRFHQAAGEIIRKADSGQSVQEKVALGAKSDYANASNAVVTSLMKMKRAA
jgi:methyl-accepting chemotaxis protein